MIGLIKGSVGRATMTVDHDTMVVVGAMRLIVGAWCRLTPPGPEDRWDEAADPPLDVVA